MAEPTSEKKDYTRDDEIDLGPVLNWLRSLFQRLGRGISYIFEVIRSYLLRISLITFLFLMLGFAFHSIQKPLYYSSMVVTSQYLSPTFYHHIISELDLMLNDKNYEGLADKLKIEKQVAENLESIYYLPLVVEEDTVREYQPFRVVVSAHDGSIFQGLTQPFLNFMEENEFAVQKKEVQTEQLKTSISMLEKEIAQLDSLKMVMEKSMLNQSRDNQTIAFFESPEPVPVYEHKMELYNLKQYKETQLAQKENIKLIYPFTVRTQADEPKLIPTLINFMVIGFLLGLGYALYLSRKRRSNKSSRT